MASHISRVKEFFTIPFTLNNSRGDTVFIIFKRPVTVRTAGFVLVLLLSNFALKRSIPTLSHGGIVRPLIFLGALDIAAWLLFATRVKTGLSGYKLFSIAKTHLLKFQGQTQVFDKTALLSDVANYLPISDVLADGTIIFDDGEKGRLIPIVGYASRNMFVAGKAITVDAFQNALRTADNSSTQYLMTVVSGQNVTNQVSALMESYEKETNPIIRQMQRDNIKKLTDYVDGQFDTLHQYVLFKYPNETSFANLLTWLQDLMTSGASVYAVQEIPKRDDVIDVFKNIFSPSQNKTQLTDVTETINI